VWEWLPPALLFGLLMACVGSLIPWRFGLAAGLIAAAAGAALFFAGERALTAEWQAAHPFEGMHAVSLLGAALLGFGLIGGPALVAGGRLVRRTRGAQVAVLAVITGAALALMVWM
jgi:hypothetical protein